jgi:hypothetical protein
MRSYLNLKLGIILRSIQLILEEKLMQRYINNRVSTHT